MNPTELLKKYGLIAGLLVASFAAGRYTMRESVTTEVQTEYSQKTAELLKEQETTFNQKLASETEKVRQETQKDMESKAHVVVVTVQKPDGTKTTTKTIDTDKKSNTTVKTDEDKTSNTSTVSIDTKDKTDQKTSDTEEKTKTITVTTPPPSWRVYGIYGLSDVTDKRSSLYGAGAMYDLGPIGVGLQTTVAPLQTKVDVALTVGISF